MRAAVVDRYGAPHVVHVAAVAQPEPRADEVLVRVAAAAVTSGDARIRAARFPPGFAPFARMAFGILRPRRHVLGTCFSGIVEAVGRDVDDLAPGDAVCGMTGMKQGAHAELVAVARKRLAHRPPEVSDDDAAGVLFGGTTALYFLRDKGSVGQGTALLVNGASGAIGTNAVQLGKHFGATVTAVTSAANAALVTELGADRVVDYSAVDLADITERFDVALDAVGNLSIRSGRALLNPGGVLLLAVAGLADIVRARGNVVAGSAPERVEDFELLLGLVADSRLRVVIDRVYELDDIAEAHRRVDTGHKVGNLIVHPAPPVGDHSTSSPAS